MEETNKGLLNFIIIFEDASDITTTFWQPQEAPNTLLSGKLKPVQVQKNNYFALVLVTIIIIYYNNYYTVACDFAYHEENLTTTYTTSGPWRTQRNVMWSQIKIQSTVTTDR